jgi:hypothetical protein
VALSLSLFPNSALLDSHWETKVRIFNKSRERERERSVVVQIVLFFFIEREEIVLEFGAARELTVSV